MAFAVLAACHYVPQDMVARPSTGTQSQETGRFKNVTILVAPVVRPDPSMGELWLALNNAPLVSAPMFQQALVDSLDNSRLFAAVVRGADARYDWSADDTASGGAKYRLTAEILKQEASGYGATVSVRYALVDTASGRSLWSDDLASSYRYPAGLNAFLSPGRTNTEALWHAFRQNIELMIGKIADLR